MGLVVVVIVVVVVVVVVVVFIILWWWWWSSSVVVLPASVISRPAGSPLHLHQWFSQLLHLLDPWSPSWTLPFQSSSSHILHQSISSLNMTNPILPPRHVHLHEVFFCSFLLPVASRFSSHFFLSFQVTSSILVFSYIPKVSI